ncbi:hypothetical protein [Clavibacter michiganensis]|uniref:hypothetical protein n=2 Tax=Clavibacter michiganensis TaxID=28447 RepID=UPI0026DB169D|nr:hypothetical protein [Clavibacter michiganensis]MDO4055141.1 hypothetical protein [Clavibacter michiganensis]MDO4070532.1 hypothetical protein [Clavibacter michiganensis]MDO4073487.1 hypothetical protein [Clavibacter michiganensis]MDO4076430.1 hypothetical protein [Clavibacter michiganensis]MDO4132109.1 hypothetical protein [Clavibacter michiganensis]
MSDAYEYPVALSRLGDGDSRDAQTTRALAWIAAQGRAPLVIVTPRRDVPAGWLKRAVTTPGTTHLTWRGLSVGTLAGRRVVHAWPDRQHLNDLWDADAAALVVIEWGELSTADWVIEASPDLLLPNQTVLSGLTPTVEPFDLPDDVDAILQSVAGWSAGNSSGLKWNEEDKLKADMMNRPTRWQGVTVEQLRARCRELGMKPNDIDTIAGFMQRRKDGRRFNVRSTYRGFHWGE